jgi:KRAB domain-containing zinc finger protein
MHDGQDLVMAEKSLTTNPSDIGLKEYKCPHCKFKSSSQFGLKVHNGMLHGTNNTKIQNDSTVQIKKEENNSASPSEVSLRVHTAMVPATNKAKSAKDSAVSNEEYKCHQCPLTFPKEISLKVHIGMLHGTKNTNEDLAVSKKSDEPPKCKECDFISPSEYLLDVHTEMVHGTKIKNKSIKCEQCDYVTTASLLKAHVRIVHGAKNKVCPQCSYASTQNCNLDRHIKSAHSRANIHKCGLCAFTGARRHSITLHMKQVHGKESDKTQDVCNSIKDVGEFKCKRCDHVASGERRLRLHVKTVHRLQRKKCPHCSFASVLTIQLRQHIISAHTSTGEGMYANKDNVIADVKSVNSSEGQELDKVNDDKVTDRKRLSCNQCDYVAVAVHRLRFHVKTVHGANTKMCPHCSFSSVLEIQLRRHIKIEHNGREVARKDHATLVEGEESAVSKCEQCGHIARNKLRLRVHIKFVHGAKTSVCSHCTFSTVTITQLKRHINSVHTRAKVHKCHLCQYKATRPDVLKAHVKAKHNLLGQLLPKANDYLKTNASKEINCEQRNLLGQVESGNVKRSLKCKQCDYVALARHRLRNHIKKVHGIKTNVCPHCSFATAVQYHLKRHIDSKHRKSQVYKCDLCDYTSGRKDNLKAHVQVKHNLEKEDDKRAQIENDKVDIPKDFIDCQTFHEVDVKKILQCTFDFKCDQCPFIAARKIYLSKHVANVHKKEAESDQSGSVDPKCIQRDLNLPTNHGLKVHTRLVHDSESKQHKCPDCSFVPSTKQGLRRHIRAVHLKIRENKCNLCDFRAARKDNLHAHVKAMHSEKSDDTSDFPITPEKDQNKCPHCNFTGRKLKRHMNSMHLKTKDRKSNQSHKTAKSETLYDDVVRVNEEEEEKSVPSGNVVTGPVVQASEFKLYKCIHCDHELPTELGLKVHIGIVHEGQNGKETISKCPPDCGFVPSTRDVLMRHIKSVHLKLKDQKCKLCDFSAARKDSLNIHVKTVHSEKKGQLVSDIKREEPASNDHVVRVNKEEEEESAPSGSVVTGPVVQASELKLYKCPDCSFVPSTRRGLMRHIKAMHLKLKDQKCNLCDFSAARNDSLKNHVKSMHSEKRRELVSDIKREEPASNEKHVQCENIVTVSGIHSGDSKLHKCIHCDHEVPTKHGLKVHIGMVHDGKYGKAAISKCPPDCGFVPSTQQGLNRHIKAVHLKLKDQKCNLCDFRVARKDSLKNHVKSKHSEKGGELFSDIKREEPASNEKHVQCENIATVSGIHSSESKLHKCIHCGLDFHTERGVEVHIELVHGGENHDCPDCSFTASTLNKLKEHNKDAHQTIQIIIKPDHECSLCDFSSARKGNLNSHVKAVHCVESGESVSDVKKEEAASDEKNDAKLIKCEQCDYAALNNRKVKTHMLSVHAEKNNKCVHCNFVASTLKRLNRHIEHRHPKDNEVSVPMKMEIGHHKCKECEYAAPSHVVLKRHINSMHLVTKYYKCDLCDMKFSRTDVLGGHVRRVHVKRGEVDVSNWIKCEHCDFLAPTVKGLNVHVGLVHPGKNKQCLHCSFTGTKLKGHFKSMHRTQNSHDCKLCDFKGPRKDYLQRHMKKDHNTTHTL